MTGNPQDSELLTNILAIGRRMAEIRSLTPLLAYLIDQIMLLSQAEHGYIFLYDAEGNISLQVGQDRDGNALPANQDQVSHTILNKALHDGKSVISTNAMEDIRFNNATSVQALQIRSIICTPLIAKNRPIGAIYVENRTVRPRFTANDIAPIEILANQAAIAIENAQLNDSLYSVNQHLRELDQLKNNFIMLISHELRTPLTSVMAYADLLHVRLAKSNAQALEMSEQLEKAVQILDRTIHEIIYVFRIISGQLHLKRAQTFLAFMFESLQLRFAPALTARNIALHIDDVHKLPPLYADDEHLMVALQNVLSNAVKYTPDGGNIWVNGRCDDTTIHLTIRDEGIGIPLREQERVFDLFHGLGTLLNHSSSKHSFRGGGLGLGLPIAKGLIEAHGGTIRLESSGYDLQALPGTICYISLPISKPHNHL